MRLGDRLAVAGNDGSSGVTAWLQLMLMGIFFYWRAPRPEEPGKEFPVTAYRALLRSAPASREVHVDIVRRGMT
jgi:hypothetical protein